MIPLILTIATLVAMFQGIVQSTNFLLGVIVLRLLWK